MLFALLCILSTAGKIARFDSSISVMLRKPADLHTSVYSAYSALASSIHAEIKRNTLLSACGQHGKAVRAPIRPCQCQLSAVRETNARKKVTQGNNTLKRAHRESPHF